MAEVRDAVFVGIGELPSGRYPQRSFMGDCVAASHLALDDAGLTPHDVDTIVLIPCLHSFVDQADLIFSRVVEELGLSETVLVVCTERWGSAPVEEMVDMLSFNGIPLEWEVPTGLSFNAIGALITARYMHETGSTAADMAEICVSLRRWANRNPNAMYRDKPLSAEQVLASRLVSSPLHAMECPMMADGAVALVMTSAERAAAGNDSWVRVAGSGGCVSHYSIGQEFDMPRMGWPTAAQRAYDAAGWGPADAQVFEVYDSYAAVMAIGIEGLGLCPRGEGGPDDRQRPDVARRRPAAEHQRRAPLRRPHRGRGRHRPPGRGGAPTDAPGRALPSGIVLPAGHRGRDGRELHGRPGDAPGAGSVGSGPMNELAQAYEAGLLEGNLLLQHCDKCDRAIMYPKHRCPHCFGSELSWRPAGGQGTLYSVTVCHLGAPTAFAAQLPYALGVVRLAEGVQLLARLLPDSDGTFDGYRCDQAVEFVPAPLTASTSGGPGVPATERPIAWFRRVS